ncbi:dihydrolipoamide acetyltransferase family protein [Bacillus massiliglaciei]|uniref:dihydrolipoamide acetyltransferase family protein n=1 Tax=Bacillus massiliglaciei TaxID=1816693 RepID=UPI000B0EAC56|nr:dihydrolipoamide acetyltransferase family protein [Bacillus massiliglaciei]
MATDILMPKLGLTMKSGNVDEWVKKEGEPVKKGEPICTISSEKLTMDVESPADGILVKVIADQGAEVPVKEVIGIVAQEGEKIASPASGTNTEEKQENHLNQQHVFSIEKPIETRSERIFASPLARKLAKEKGIDLALVKGTGSNNRITRRDIEAFEHSASKEAASAVELQAVPNIPAAESVGAGLAGMRKVIAKRMRNSMAQTAQLTLHRKADLTAFMKFKTDLKNHLTETEIGGSLSVTACVAKAAVLALREFPEMNSWYEPNTVGFKTFEEVHLGMATALSDGLMVPVIRDAHRMGLKDLSGAIASTAQAAREGDLENNQVTGSTFTITNLGQSGVEYFTPILNTPETGILGVASLQEKLTLDEQGKPVKSKELPLSLTFDHQIIDGAPAAEFLARVVTYLEKPYTLLL